MKKLDFDKYKVFTEKELRETFKLMNVYDYAIIVNGCGSSGIYSLFSHFIAKTISNLVSGVHYESCAFHDLCFHLGGSDKDFEAANEYFISDMFNANNEYALEEELILNVKASVYYFLVDNLGQDSFNHWNVKPNKPRTKLPSFEYEKPDIIYKFEIKHNVLFIWYLNRYVLSEEDELKVKGIFKEAI